jgi:flagellar protein FlaG
MSIQTIPTATIPVASPAANMQSAETVRQTGSPTAELPREQIERVVEEIGKAVAPVAQDLRFSIDQQTGKTVIRVVDSATNQVIRQIPSEEVLAIARTLDRLGMLLHHKA